jgi:hypothetical protein
MLWPLAASLIAGTLPGVLLGYVVRVRFFPDPRAFKLFVGIVLLYIGMRLVVAAGVRGSRNRPATGRPTFRIERVMGHMRAVAVHFDEATIHFKPVAVFLLGLLVGMIGGIYGIGGGAILAPVLITFFMLPVHIIAGAVLAVNFMTSLAGVLVYSSVPMLNGHASPPDWHLGALLGFGGLCGMYAGARLQRFLPEPLIRTVLAVIALGVASRYIVQYF